MNFSAQLKTLDGRTFLFNNHGPRYFRKTSPPDIGFAGVGEQVLGNNASVKNKRSLFLGALKVL